jgi:hypothetical protein
MSKPREYEIIQFLILKGFDETTAWNISEHLGIELSEDLVLLEVEAVSKMEFLTDDQKRKLWATANEISMAWLLSKLEQQSL